MMKGLARTKSLPTVAIRVDSGYHVGSGHVRRCLSLAVFLKANGFSVVFICRNISGSVSCLIGQAGFGLVLLPENKRFAFSVFSSAFSAADFDNMAYDAEESAEAFASQYPGAGIAWVVTDHMLIRKAWQMCFADKMNCKIMAIDGQANKPHYADVLLDPQIHENPMEKWKGLLPGSCALFSGPGYLPLSPAFESARNKASVRSGALGKVLVCFGGTDTQDLVHRTVLTLLAWLERLPSLKITVDVAVPANLASIKRLEELIAGRPHCHLHIGLTDLSPLMLSADLAVGGGGIMLWERCLLGLPAIVVPLAENQEKPIERLEAQGTVISVRSPAKDYEEGLTKALRHVFRNPEVLRSMSNAAFGVMSDWPRTDDWLNVVKGCTDEWS